MSGSSTETLTAALRRLADEHASGLLSVATVDRDVVLELADGVPVGIGPTHDVSVRVGRDAGPELVAAAVVDELVARTVAAIVGGGGQWTWDVASDAAMMPVPEGLVAELRRRAVDAAQALAELDADLVLQPARDLPTTGEVARIRALFDGQRSVEDVAAEARVTLPAVATIAAALVRAGVLSVGTDDSEAPRWTDTVANSAHEDDEDEPEPWVMDEPDDADQPDVPEPREERDADPATAGSPQQAATTGTGSEDGAWLDEIDAANPAPDEPPVVEASSGDRASNMPQQDAGSALSAMISELQGTGAGEVQTRKLPPSADQATDHDEPDADGSDKVVEANRKQPKAEPGEVAEFLRELSRLALDDD